MPLRFRAVVPYTLPGVLALIGWWWYISRKKERLISHGSPEGAPTATSLRTSSAEGSNGLLEKGTVSPTNDTEGPTHIPPRVSNQRTEHGKISQVEVQVAEEAPSLERSSEEATAGRTTGEEVQPSDSTLPPPGKDDILQMDDHKDPEQSSSRALELGDHLVKEEAILPCQATKVSSPSPTMAHLSDAERPEPEGEVAKHCSVVHSQEEVVVCAVTPAKVQRAIPSEIDSLETPPSAQDFHQHMLTSTPTFPALTTVQDPSTRSETPEDIQVHSGSAEEQDLELLASGLITEVISAATQEVLGVTSCQVTGTSQLSCSSTPLGSGRLCSQQEPITAAKQHHLLASLMEREAAEKEEQGMPNGCSRLSHRVHQTNGAQRGHWPTPSHQAAQSAPSLNAKLKSDDAAALAEDSACSTCHSDDGISSEDLQNSTSCDQTDTIQVTDCSARETTQPLVETATEAAEALTETEENSVDAVCEIKRLNGVGLRNGALGMCELETDQSGGEMLMCFIWFVVVSQRVASITLQTPAENIRKSVIPLEKLIGGSCTALGQYQSRDPPILM